MLLCANMINIILDTNIFTKNPKLDNAAFSSIKGLAKANKLCIHLPYIIENEYLSQLRENYFKDIHAIKNSLIRLEKKKLSLDLVSETKSLLKKTKK